jgi:hypothetical protein
MTLYRGFRIAADVALWLVIATWLLTCFHPSVDDVDFGNPASKNAFMATKRLYDWIGFALFFTYLTLLIVAVVIRKRSNRRVVQGNRRY